MLPSANVLAAIFGISEIALGIVKRSRQRDAKADAGSLRLLWVVILVSLAIGWMFARTYPEAALPAAAQVYVAGFALFVLGALLRWYSIFYLGRFFTVDVRVSSDHRVIDTGPYRWIRHPSYTGILLEFLGYALCLGNALSLGMILLPVIVVFMYRIQVEERALRQGLGESYEAYCRRTKRLIPLVY
ncbi:MAG TPA: isoprenylcysteine carboxylmethyltransferase family protein [Steroidobacteraceae bacterium]|nr:isoprenylcysteine carboxylmethyltransferase family protein [Steroidobacteraceae bacterium]